MSRAMAGPVASERAPNEFERVVVLANPVCTRVDRAFSLLSGLEESDYTGARRINVPTERDPAATKDKLAEAVLPGDIVVVAGGDKTVGDAAEVLMGSDIPLLPIWAGNANDIAHMLNGKDRRRRSLLEIIQHGNVVPLYPIQRQTSLPDGPKRIQTAANYVGYGLSGLISGRVNDPGYRASDGYHRAGFRRRHENVIGVRAALERPRFSLAWGSETPDRFVVGDKGGAATVLDMTIAAGDRMGKRGHVMPVELADQRLFVGRLEPGIVQAAAGIGRMAMHHTAGQHLELGEVLSFQLSSEAWSHTDGDARQLPATTVERVWQSDIPYLAISTLIQP